MVRYIIPLLLLASSAFALEDGFDYPDGSEGAPSWFAESVAWEVRDGQMVVEGGKGHSFAIQEGVAPSRRLECEATVTVLERRPGQWGVAGLALYQDGGNYWALEFVEAPDDMGSFHAVELAESFEGQWLAHTNPATKVTSLRHEGGDFAWEYGRPYRLRLVVSPEGIEGTLSEMDGTQRSRFAFIFDNRATTWGRLAFKCGGLAATFDDLAVTVSDPVVEEGGRTPPLAYTGPTGGERMGKATGFFHTREADGRWWMVDPKGRAFYMVGTDHVNYRVHSCEALRYAPHARFVAEKYGGEEAWGKVALARLKEWGFNALTAGHSESLRHRGLPHTEFLAMGASFSDHDDICPKTWWTGFPNVFSPKWARHCDKIARKMCKASRDDPWLIGYFLDNELEWYGKKGTEWGLFHEAWLKPAEHSAKQAWVALLRAEAGDIATFNAAWGVNLDSFDALAVHTDPGSPRNDAADAMALAWVRLIAQRYFETCAEAIRRYDPNHMIIGSRFAGQAPGIWDIAGASCDVVTFNMYPRIDVEGGVPASVIDEISEFYKAAGKPLAITEWSFPALDTPMPSTHGAGMRVDTQKQRAQCFTHFQTALFSLPFMVGSDFFMYVDEPALGISKDFPEDGNYGLVSERDEPYPDLTEAARRLNPRANDRHAKGEVRTAPELDMAPWLADLPAELPMTGTSATWRADDMYAVGPVGASAWMLSTPSREGQGGEEIPDSFSAALYPLLQQKSGENFWIRPETAQIVSWREDEDLAVVDMEFGYGGDADVSTEGASEAAATPGSYRMRCRYWFPGEDAGWLAAQCLWVENTGATPWKLESVYHYLVPEARDDEAEKVESLFGPTPYHERGNAWVDRETGQGAGCWYARDGDFLCTYWKDDNGWYHPDLRREEGAMVEPGARHETARPVAFFFTMGSATRQSFARKVQEIRTKVTVLAER